MNIQKRLRMDLEQALMTYGEDIDYLILRDGTTIEIIDDNNDEFVEEKIENNYNYDNYMYKEINQDGTLRGKKTTLQKPLRKTVLKSTMMNNQGKLKSTVDKDKIILKHSENNEYLQCANCFKFFNSNENDEETDNTSNQSNNNNINNNINNNPINQQNIPRQIPAQPQQPQQDYNQNKYPNNQPFYQPQQRYNQNNPPYYQKIPAQYPPNPQQRMNMPPQPQQQYYYNNNNNQIPRGNPRMPYYNNNQNNPMFRSRKRNSGKYQQKESKSEFIQINKYPGSAKKGKNPEFNYELSNQEKGYIDNNLGNYLNENENKYYEYPSTNYNKKNYFAHSSSKKQENNYYHHEIEEFQENDFYRY